MSGTPDNATRTHGEAITGRNAVMGWHAFVSWMTLLIAWVNVSASVAQTVRNCEIGQAEADLDINNVRARVYNTGGLFWRGFGNYYTVPKRGQANAVFTTNIWIGGMADGELRFAGTTFSPWEFWPGPLDALGHPPDDCSEYDRIYEIRRDSLRHYEQTGKASRDLIEWPVALGAPVIDGDGIEGNYNLGGGDRPALVGDQMLWWVMNDAGNIKEWSKRAPFPLEVQVTAFAFSDLDDYPGLKNIGSSRYLEDVLWHTTFYRFRLVYKGRSPLEEAWFGLHADTDLGDFSDDFVGSDSTLGLGFTYNGDEVDGRRNPDYEHVYDGPPPALGYDFFKGPIINPDGLDNDDDGEIDEEGERAGMTRFLFYSGDSSVYGSPHGDTSDPYNYLRGMWRDGTTLTYGTWLGYGGTTPTHFVWTGNPPNYWSEENTDGQGARNIPSDRRFVMSTGPFRMEPGDEQEIIVGIVWARGEDRLKSVYKLKWDDALIQSVFDELIQPHLPDTQLDIPYNYALFHNYPNPFSSRTTITYHLPVDDTVILRVFDVLAGRSPR